MVLFSLERVQKAHTGHGFSAEGPLPGIMIQLLAGMMDLDRNLMRKCFFTLCDWLGYPFQKSGRGKELKEVLNNGQTACANSSFFFFFFSFFGGADLSIPNNSDEKGICWPGDILESIQMYCILSYSFQKATLRDTSLLLEVLCKFSCLIKAVRFILPFNWHSLWEMSAWWLKQCVVLVFEYMPLLKPDWSLFPWSHSTGIQLLSEIFSWQISA